MECAEGLELRMDRLLWMERKPEDARRMRCPDFLARFSEFYDGNTSSKDRRLFQEHLDACASCRRYHEVVRRGVELVRELPEPRPRDDFRDRLQHSIYALEEERRRRRGASGGPGLLALVLVAGVLAVVVWSPGFVSPEPAVELSPIVVPEPPVETPSRLGSVPPPLQPAGYGSTSPLENPDLWASSNALLFRHSPLYERYRDPGLVRTGLR